MRETASMLVAGIPLKRGTPRHFEHDDEVAMTGFDAKTGKVLEIHTPRDTMRRVHELMHARASDVKRAKRQYKGIKREVEEITEDCLIHVKHWPWRGRKTPQQIEGDVREYIAGDLVRADKCRQAIADRTAKDPQGAAWANYALRLRAAAVLGGMSGYGDWYHSSIEVDFTEKERALALRVFDLIERRREGKAAQLLQSVFFPPIEIGFVGGSGTALSGISKAPGGNGDGQGVSMEIIELNHTEAISDAVVGIRIATSGPRLYRPALRKPVIPNRCFVRRSPQEPGGTILIDASGSMGNFDYIKGWCERAPFGTIAYYAGNGGSKGWLYVYARDGMRSREIVEPPSRGNTVDGPAMDWLMRQEGPRIMVTDKEFCDAIDSDAQVVRLENLEARGEIEVLNYNRDDE